MLLLDIKNGIVINQQLQKISFPSISSDKDWYFTKQCYKNQLMFKDKGLTSCPFSVNTKYEGLDLYQIKDKMDCI